MCKCKVVCQSAYERQRKICIAMKDQIKGPGVCCTTVMIGALSCIRVTLCRKINDLFNFQALVPLLLTLHLFRSLRFVRHYAFFHRRVLAWQNHRRIGSAKRHLDHQIRLMCLRLKLSTLESHCLTGTSRPTHRRPGQEALVSSFLHSKPFWFINLKDI